MSMNTTITPHMAPTTLLGPNYLDCQHELSPEEFKGVTEVQMTLSTGKLTVDLRGTRPDPDDKTKDPDKRRKITFGIRLYAKQYGHWVRETALPNTPQVY